MKINIKPRGFNIEYSKLPVGLFMYKDTICFITEYDESFIVESGESFWGGTSDKLSREKLICMPLEIEVVE